MMKIIYPKQVILEITSLCNLRCKGCGIHGPMKFTTRPLGHIEKYVWEKAIKEIGSWPLEVNLTTHGGGEPLLHPEFIEIISFAKKFSNIKVGFLTNATLLNKNLSEILLNTGIDWIAFSIDGVSEESFNKVRKGANFKIVEKNVLDFLELRDKGNFNIDILINMVLYDEIKKEAKKFLNKWSPLVDIVRLSYFRNPPSSRRWKNVPQKREACSLLWEQIVISSKGYMGLCCEDFNIDYKIGNIKNFSIIELWNNKRMNYYRNLHLENQFEKIKICQECDTWADNKNIYETVKNNIKIKNKVSGIEFIKIK